MELIRGKDGLTDFERRTRPDEQGNVAWTHLLVAIYADGTRRPWACGEPPPGEPLSTPTPWGAWVYEPLQESGTEPLNANGRT